MTTVDVDVRRYADLTLSVYLEALADQRRVLWIGRAASGAPERIAARAKAVLVLDPDGAPEQTAGAQRTPGLRLSRLRPGPLSFREGSFDLALVPDIDVLGTELSQRVDDLRAVLGEEGALALGAPNPQAPVRWSTKEVADDALEYETLFDLLAERFAVVRMIGQAPFAGYAVADLAPVGDSAQVSVDGSLVGREDPERWIAVCAQQELAVDPYAIVQLPAAPLASGPATDEPTASGSVDWDADAEYRRLEEALIQRSEELAELRQEVHRRGTLVRDLVSQLEQPATVPDPGDAMSRAVEAEAARAEAQFKADELEAQLAELREAKAESEARWMGTAQGLRSRLSELEEVREHTEGRLLLLQSDLEEANERRHQLEQQVAELGEQLELEIVRSRGATRQQEGESERIRSLEQSEQELAERVGRLAGELVSCGEVSQQIATERDQARAEALSLMAQLSSLENRIEGMRLGYERRIAEVLTEANSQAQPAGRPDADLDRLVRQVAGLRGETDGLRARLRDREQALAVRGGETGGEQVRDLQQRLEARDELVTRLQADLSEQEQTAKDRGHRADQLGEENKRLREALVDASDRVDRANEQRDSALEALRELRHMLGEVELPVGEAQRQGGREITAAGMEAPEEASGQAVSSNAPDAELQQRLDETRRELADRDTLIRSLTAQVEERDERLRTLEGQSEAQQREQEGEHDDLQRELAELQEREARLREELENEREKRRAAEAEQASSEGDGEELRRVRERLGERESELAQIRSRVQGYERDLAEVRSACADVRNGLEELLSSATASGDPSTAERIGSLLRLLNQL